MQHINYYINIVALLTVCINSFPQYHYRVILLFFIMIIMFSFDTPKRFSDMS